MASTEVTYQPTTHFWIVAHGVHAEIPIEERPLPSHIFLREGGIMVLRGTPVCVDKPYPKDQHSRTYANLLMYLPWKSEADYLGDAAASPEKCQEMWEDKQVTCQNTADELKRMLRDSILG